jgi:hypothetical protein
MAMHRAANPKPIPEVQPEEPKVLSLNDSAEAQAEEPTTPAKPRYVMPSLEALKAQQANQLPVDTRTAKERDVFDPEFGF